MKNKKIYFNTREKADKYLQSKTSSYVLKRDYNVEEEGYFAFNAYDKHWVLIETVFVKHYNIDKRSAKRLVQNNIRNIRMIEKSIEENDNGRLELVWVDHIMTGNFFFTRSSIRKIIRNAIRNKDACDFKIYDNCIYFKNSYTGCEHVIVFTAGIHF
ncbi:MAG: hypothetical protein ACRCRT_02635 [Cetobacterium somerae]